MFLDDIKQKFMNDYTFIQHLKKQFNSLGNAFVCSFFFAESKIIQSIALYGKYVAGDSSWLA